MLLDGSGFRCINNFLIEAVMCEENSKLLINKSIIIYKVITTTISSSSSSSTVYTHDVHAPLKG